ncbi:mevalonate kinase [Clostridiales bacterium COT073_COT-073]|nr:mevalonate kinase [Clostridiales bacterium COT073_COT-073]
MIENSEDSDMSGYGQAHGKVILMGEHSVVYGYPAIALPFAEAKIEGKVSYEFGEIWLESDFYTGELKNAPKEREHLVCAVYATLDHLNQEKKNLKIVVTSDLPASRGLGSSAAVAVAVIRALFQYFGKEIADEELIALAHQAEQIAHGNPSGIDVLTTAFEQPIWFRKSLEKKGIKEIKPITISLPAFLIVADTEIYGQTKEAVGIIASKLRQNPEETERLLNELGSFAMAAEKEIERKDCKALGELMNKAHHNLKCLGVSHPVLNHLAEKALQYGALGAKMTGGGLGGCMICLTDTRETAEMIAQKLKPEGAKNTWIYPLNVK